MWNSLINDLIEAGLSETEIGAKVKLSQPSINRIRNEKQEPGFEAGTALVNLHRELCLVERRRRPAPRVALAAK